MVGNFLHTHCGLQRRSQIARRSFFKDRRLVMVRRCQPAQVNLITSRKPDDLSAFNAAIVDAARTAATVSV